MLGSRTSSLLAAALLAGAVGVGCQPPGVAGFEANTTPHIEFQGTNPESDGGVDLPDAGEVDAGTVDAGPQTPMGCEAYEPNDTLATAVALEPGFYPGLALCASDIDLFTVQVPAQHVLSARLKFVNAAGNLDLYFSNGTTTAMGQISTFASSVTTTFDEEEILNQPFAQPTKVWVVVHGKGGAQGAYDLELKIEPGVQDRDCFSDCKTLVQLQGSSTWGSAQSIADGYYMATLPKYAWGRRDLTGLVKYATREVQARFPATASDVVAVGDICQQDGLTPGVDVNQPRHPTTTHVKGRDIDIGYYQNDGKSNYGIICGDGTDTNWNGQPGKHNDGYFCTTNQNVVDVPRHVWFMAKLAESPLFRVVGIDQTLVQPFRDEARKLYDDGQIGVRQYRRITEGLGFGAMGGWQFHHHHIHLSLYED